MHQVHLEGGAEGLLARTMGEGRCVAHENVDPAKCSERACGQRVNLSLVGQVAAHRNRFATACDD